MRVRKSRRVLGVGVGCVDGGVSPLFLWGSCGRGLGRERVLDCRERRVVDSLVLWEGGVRRREGGHDLRGRVCRESC